MSPMSRSEPLTTQRNPEVTWSPHTSGRCPCLAPPPAHRYARSPATGSAIPQSDPNVLVRSPQGSNSPEGRRCPGKGPLPPHRVPVGLSIHHTGPDVPARAHLSLPRSAPGSLQFPLGPRSLSPGPGPHSPPGPDHLTARSREVDHPICAGGLEHTTGNCSGPSGYGHRVSPL